MEELDLYYSVSLQSIPEGIVRLSRLKSINCEGCQSLTSPPLGVCSQGMPAIRKYFADLKKGHTKKFIPVTVIGRTIAGKTSLVWSLQRSKRVLSKRCESSKFDDATKVFKVCEADVDAESMLVFHDFGGQAIYHFAYPLSSRSQFVPMLVIDIAKFDKLATEHGVEYACEKVCFDWLAHLYLSCPQAGPPLVVLTHCDGLSSKICKERKSQL